MHKAARTCFRRTALLFAAVLAVSVTVAEEPRPEWFDPKVNVLSPQVQRVLDEGQLELLSLNPTLPSEKQRRRFQSKLFHGYRVLGTTKIEKAEQREELLAALRGAISGARGAYIYCFEPRHGIRATTESEMVDLSICFECEKLYVYSPQRSTLYTSATAQPIFDRILKRGNRSWKAALSSLTAVADLVPCYGFLTTRTPGGCASANDSVAQWSAVTRAKSTPLLMNQPIL